MPDIFVHMFAHPHNAGPLGRATCSLFNVCNMIHTTGRFAHKNHVRCIDTYVLHTSTKQRYLKLQLVLYSVHVILTIMGHLQTKFISDVAYHDAALLELST